MKTEHRDWEAKWVLVGSYHNDEEYDEHCFGDRTTSNGSERTRAEYRAGVRPLDEILWAMEPGQYQTQCPCHEDDEASLGILIIKGKKPIVNCFAGCDWKKIQDYVTDHS